MAPHEGELPGLPQPAEIDGHQQLGGLGCVPKERVKHTKE